MGGWVVDRQGPSKPERTDTEVPPGPEAPAALLLSFCSPEQATTGTARAAPDQGKATLSLSPQILSEYDIILVQEVRDADLSSVNDLMDQLNR